VYTSPEGCQPFEVGISAERGATCIVLYSAADDFRTVVNPLQLSGQVQGRIGEGIGQALLERRGYDTESDQLLTGWFMDDALPRADDLSLLDSVLDEAEPGELTRLAQESPARPVQWTRARPWSTPSSARCRTEGPLTWTCGSRPSLAGDKPGTAPAEFQRNPPAAYFCPEDSPGQGSIIL
jgi:hypothetical protein